MTRNFMPVAAVAGALLCLGGGTAVHAQAQPERQLPPITLDLRDAPIRQALEQVFAAAKVDYTLDNNVQGFVTLKVTDIPFETALRLIMRSASIPLTYTREGGVYIVRPRAITDPLGGGAFGPGGAPPPSELDPNLVGAGTTTRSTYEPIQLTYTDPASLSGILGIQLIPIAERGGGGGMGGGGGFGGGGFGGGGMGGGGMMGGGMGGGMMGGGMGGGMMGGGGMGGGMMGGGMGGGGFGGGGMGGGFGGGFGR